MGDRELIEAAKSAAAWLDRWASHVGNCRGGGLCQCGLTAIQNDLEIAIETLASRPGWVMVPREPTPAMLERAAFNLCAEYGVEFVKPLGQFAQDAYAELLSAAPKP